ncbi:hypothetical protein Pve01_91150 [Planomonospora venezuelensis]|nr:hypothetical protein Pve01_91150 [Planomonospora venezuelensis]
MISQRIDRIDEDRARALAGLLDFPPDDIHEIEAGRLLRPMWHLPFLLARPAQSDLGSDGHPRVGEVVPPAPGLRRMFAGGRVRLTPGLRIGDDAVATTAASPSRERVGRSGRMHFITLTTTVEQDGATALREERDLVYLHHRASKGGAARVRIDVNEEIGPVVQEVPVDETLLFRFSALTYNAHRIHYDRDYARDVEGYEGLVVHGPLQALLMAEVATQAVVGCPTAGTAVPMEFTYRLVAQLSESDGLLLHRGTVSDQGVAVAIADRSGRMTARGHLRADAGGTVGQ